MVCAMTIALYNLCLDRRVVSDNKALLSTMNQRDALFPLRIATKHKLLPLSAIMKIQTNNLPSITMVKLFTTNQASALVQD